jgi:hypothetical protein
MRRMALAIVVLTVAIGALPVAAADPPALHDGVACTADLSGVMTWQAAAMVRLVCADGRWQTVTSPQPPNDRWLSVGPAITLHGEGMRNPDVASGQWTAVPQEPGSQCRAVQQAVVSPGVKSAPQVSEGQPGQQLSLQLQPRLFSVDLSGYCLWTHTPG